MDNSIERWKNAIAQLSSLKDFRDVRDNSVPTLWGQQPLTPTMILRFKPNRGEITPKGPIRFFR